jgi:DNA helicase-2/ATP-dependent DNA helicase PcrA
VVRAADTLLRHNRRRVPKMIRAHRADGDGFMVAPSIGNSVAITVQAIQTAIGAGAAPRDIAALTRVNSLQAPVQVALRAAGVATNGGVGSEFLERTAVRATLAWLRLARATGGLAAADVGEALRRPSRPLHPRIAAWVGEQTSLVGLRRLATRITTERDAITVDQFAADIDQLQQLINAGATTEQVLTTVRDSFGLASSIAKLDAHRHGMNRTAQNDDLTALAQLALLLPDPQTFEQWLRSSLALKGDADGVTLATVHRVKGQEWPFVIVHHADADQFPHRLAEDIEEERRLFHVAITRASRDVLVVPAEKPSPFISECSSEPRVITVAPKATPAKPPATPLFEELRALRLVLAAGKPAFVVFADSVLRDIAAARPTSLDQLAAIKGLGPTKLQQYGAAILEAVATSTSA